MKKLTVLGTGPETKTIHVAPGVTAGTALDAEKAGLELPTLGFFRWLPAGDGTYRPSIIVQERMIRATLLAHLLDIDHMNIRRLATAGFLRWDRPTPSVLRISLESWAEHEAKVKADPWFWEDEANKARYSASL